MLKICCILNSFLNQVINTLILRTSVFMRISWGNTTKQQKVD